MVFAKYALAMAAREREKVELMTELDTAMRAFIGVRHVCRVCHECSDTYIVSSVVTRMLERTCLFLFMDY